MPAPPPDIAEAMKDPDIAAAMLDMQSNPGNMDKHMSNPKVAAFIHKITAEMGEGGGGMGGGGMGGMGGGMPSGSAGQAGSAQSFSIVPLLPSPQHQLLLRLGATPPPRVLPPHPLPARRPLVY